MDSSIAAKIDFSKAFKIAKLMLIIVIMIIIIYYFVVISVIKFCMRLPSPALGALHKAMKKNRNLIIIKVIPLFCIAHPLLRIRFRHPRWRRFFPLARKEQTRAAFAELKLLFAIIMSQIGRQLPCLLSKDKKMKEMCVIPKSAAIFHFAAVELWNY